ncbi:MAG: trypsin-like serine peptidase [Candidatus Gastranaerophilaceae bacterium]|nr:hypothetical protein [Christensenellales bacterium]
MKTKIICSVIVLIMLTSVFPSALALDETQKPIPADLQALIDKAYDPNNDISESDWQRIINEGGKATQDLLDFIDSIALTRDVYSSGGVDYMEDDPSFDKSGSMDTVEYDPFSKTEKRVNNDYIFDIVPEEDPLNDNIEGSADGKVLSLMPKAYPYNWFEYSPQSYADTRSTYYIRFKSNGAWYSGTAFKIGNRYLATAGHNIYDYKSKSWSTNFTLTPAQSGTKRPYGSTTSIGIEVASRWYNDNDSNYDWGMIKVERTLVSDRLSQLLVDNVTGWTVRSQGYLDLSGGHYMHLIRDRVINSWARRCRANMVLDKGKSGGPVLDERKYAMGIIIGEKGDFVKFEKDLYNLIATYRTKA